MPGLPDDKVSVSVILDKKAVEKIDKLAKLLGLSRSKMVRNLAYVGLDEAKVLKSLGLFHAVVMVRTFREYVREGRLKEKSE